jgi:hypothetical protein
MYYGSSFILLNDVFKCLRQEAKAVGLDCSKLITWVTPFIETRCKRSKSGEIVLSAQDLIYLLSNWAVALEENRPALIATPRGHCLDNIVGVEEFVLSSEYMGQRGTIWPGIIEALREVFNPERHYIEIVLTGAIGTGKTYLADLIQAYSVYLLLSYHSPQMEYDMSPGESIYFVFQNRTLTLARKVTFGKFSGLVRSSKFFREKFPPSDQITSELAFPKQIGCIPLAGSDTAALGFNVMGGVIDECNFFARVERSLHTRFTGEEEYDQAENVYRTIIRRMKSRFQRFGSLPGKLCLVSASNYPGDFTDRKVKEAEDDPTIFVYRKSQWDALPRDRFSGKKFLIELGNDYRRSRLIGDAVDVVDPDSVIEVPIEYKKDFVRDIDAAVRDLAGMPTGVCQPFLSVREKVNEARERCWRDDRGNPYQLFIKDRLQAGWIEQHILGPSEPGFEETVIRHLVDPRALERLQAVKVSPPCAVHLDLGLTSDNCGIGISRVIGMQPVSRRLYEDADGKTVVETDVNAPIYEVVGALAIEPPGGGGEIDIDLLLAIVLGIGTIIPIRYGSLDSFESAWLLQAFRKRGMITGIISVDATPLPYLETKAGIYEARMVMPYSEILFRELVYLQRDRKSGKIDHPLGGSKDVADAVAASCWSLLKNLLYVQTPIPVGAGVGSVRVSPERVSISR